MAELKSNNGTSSNRVYATDEQGMMADAIDYAKRDMGTIFKVFEKIGIVPTKPEDLTKSPNEISIELLAKAVLAVKYEQINHARNDRPAWEQYL